MASTEIKYDRSRMQQTYCNHLKLAYSTDEVILDFGFAKIDTHGEVEILQRIITSVPHALRIKDLLDKHLSAFERGEKTEETEVESDAT